MAHPVVDFPESQFGGGNTALPVHDVGDHISMKLLYCTINPTSRYNINKEKFTILSKLSNTK